MPKRIATEDKEGTRQVAFRLPNRLLADLDALAVRMRRELPWCPANRADALRLAARRGLEVLVEQSSVVQPSAGEEIATLREGSTLGIPAAVRRAEGAPDNSPLDLRDETPKRRKGR